MAITKIWYEKTQANQGQHSHITGSPFRKAIRHRIVNRMAVDLYPVAQLTNKRPGDLLSPAITWVWTEDIKQ